MTRDELLALAEVNGSPLRPTDATAQLAFVELLRNSLPADGEIRCAEAIPTDDKKDVVLLILHDEAAVVRSSGGGFQAQVDIEFFPLKDVRFTLRTQQAFEPFQSKIHLVAITLDGLPVPVKSGPDLRPDTVWSIFSAARNAARAAK